MGETTAHGVGNTDTLIAELGSLCADEFGPSYLPTMDGYHRYERMVTHMLEFGALNERRAAASALETAITAFAEGLTSDEARRLASELPSPASRWIADAEHGQALRPTDLYERVAAEEGIEAAFATEHAQVALEALAEAISNEARQWLSHRLGDAWGRLLQPRARVASPPKRASGALHDQESRSLSEGRPGSSHPVSESAPLRHTDSVGAQNPHGDRKISSVGNAVSEPLSSGKPGSKHPLSEGD